MISENVILVAFAMALSFGSAKAAEPLKSISQYAHTSWTAKDGIPGPVRAIVQTQDGYLWLGTDAGLYRFDGRRFTPADSILGPVLASSRVTSLFVSHNGDLWVGFGTARISRVRDSEVKAYGIDDGVPAGAIASIVEDGDARIWASGPYGLVKLEGGKWHRVGRESGYLAPAAQSMKVDAYVPTLSSG